MPRETCCSCERAIANCICAFTSNVDNEVFVVVLQHPLEKKQNKATLPIMAKSLNNIEVIVGEDFTDNHALNAILARFKQNAYLLYPSDDAVELSQFAVSSNIALSDLCLILLDGTWKKAYKMFQLSKNIQALPSLSLPDNIIGQYTIRKTMKDNALSTLEAACYGLMQIENNTVKYQTLLDGFVRFNQHQLSFVPQAHQKN